VGAVVEIDILLCLLLRSELKLHHLVVEVIVEMVTLNGHECCSSTVLSKVTVSG
jgi:hypothetical protein